LARPGRWRFAGHELEEASARLLSGGQWHVLDHGSFGVLVALLRNAGAVVGKDELLESGWPGRVVSENSLNKAVGRLRHALGDATGELLGTAHGYGYRLATHAQWQPGAGDAGESLAPEASEPAIPPSAPASGPAPGPTPAAAAARGSRRPAAAIAAIGALVVLLAIGVAWRSWPTRAAMAPSPAIADTRPAAELGDGPSIAVLPFVDMSEGHDQRYFSDGLADELMDRLAKLPQLRVASRTSSFALRDSSVDIRDIGRKLLVSSVLEGSVRRDGDRVRITVQLIKASDGFHLWSETYDKRMTDLFDVQDDIARAVVAALKLELLPGQDLAVTRHRTNSMAAFESYLAGHRLQESRTSDGERRAIAAYERAIALDPEFSSAYAALGDVLGGDGLYAEGPDDVSAGKARSIGMFDRAIGLEPDNANFYLQRADLLYYTRRNWRAAQRDLDTAARLFRRRPPELLVRQCRLLAVLGRLDDAIALERMSLAVNPEFAGLRSLLGFHLASGGRYAEADAALAEAARQLPDDDHNNYYVGLSKLLQGKPGEAREAFERSGTVFRLVGLSASAHSAGDEAGSRMSLDTLVSRYGSIGAYQVAEAYAWRGDREQAFQWLHRAEQQQDAGLAQLKFDPLMRPLHADPRYSAWLGRLGLSG
jgi:TolB-like protein/DNA-binding winged helix-turn-helix (wHTH) protein/tetratricopeptide (TPR) repeat protein